MVNCPFCGSEEVRLSHRQRAVWFTIYRCRKCHQRFRVPNLARRLWIGGLVSVAVLAGVTWHMFRPGNYHSPPSTSLRLPSGPDRGIETNLPEYQVALRLWQQGDYAGAFEWFQKAAEQGSALARYELGKAYLYGRGTPQHYALAATQLLQAAQANCTEAQYLLAQLYQQGQGVTQDLVHAYMWLNVAASRGHASAALERDRIKATMWPEEIQLAQEWSLRWITNTTQSSGGGEPTAP